MRTFLVCLSLAFPLIDANPAPAQGPVRRILRAIFMPPDAYVYSPGYVEYSYTAPATYVAPAPVVLTQSASTAPVITTEVWDVDDQPIVDATWSGPYIDGGVSYVIRANDGERFYWDGLRYHQRFFEREGRRYDRMDTTLRFSDGWRPQDLRIQAGIDSRRPAAGQGPNRPRRK